MNKYHVVLEGSIGKMNFILHRDSLEEAKKDAWIYARSQIMTVVSVTFNGESK